MHKFGHLVWNIHQYSKIRLVNWKWNYHLRLAEQICYVRFLCECVNIRYVRNASDSSEWQISLFSHEFYMHL